MPLGNYKHGVTRNWDTLCRHLSITMDNLTACPAAMAAFLTDMARSFGTSAEEFREDPQDSMRVLITHRVVWHPNAMFEALEHFKVGERHL